MSNNLEKISLHADGEDLELYVLEQTMIAGHMYLLVTEDEDGDGEAMILKDLSADGDEEAVYEFVEDDDELNAVGAVFADLLDDVDLI